MRLKALKGQEKSKKNASFSNARAGKANKGTAKAEKDLDGFRVKLEMKKDMAMVFVGDDDRVPDPHCVPAMLGPLIM